MQLLRDGVLVKPEQTETRVTKSGIIISNYIFDKFDRFKSNSAYGEVVLKGSACTYLDEGDRVIYGYGTHWSDMEKDGEKYLYFNEEKNILGRINASGTYDCHPDYCIVQISKKDRDSLFSRMIKRDDGTEVELFINVPADSVDERFSKFFVQTGEVILVGDNVEGIRHGDIAIIDYNLDNDENIIVGYNGDDKLIIVNCITKRHSEDEIVYANRRTPKDTIVSKKGDYDRTSQLLGAVRGEELIAIDPFVFLEHKSNVVEMKTKSGILYSKTEKVILRKVFAVSHKSSDMFGIQKGENILMMESDVFEVTIAGKTITVVNDLDVIANSEMMDKLKRVATK